MLSGGFGSVVLFDLIAPTVSFKNIERFPTTTQIKLHRKCGAVFFICDRV